MRVRKVAKLTFTALSDPRNKRNPGRRDGFQYNCASFLCPVEVDGFVWQSRDTADAVAEWPIAVDEHDDHVLPADSKVRDADRDCVERAAEPDGRREVSIWEMARYVDAGAKRKGPAKDFEVIRGPARVIALDDDVLSVASGSLATEDWELEGSEFDGSEFELLEEEDDDDDSEEVRASQDGPSRLVQEEDDFLLARQLQEEEDARFAAEQMRVYDARVAQTAHG
ncbi:hypothetical protein HMN09_00975700 [Mycena chlorophos]|uniref:Uncharacterized protein n=1 Tax=Mycena chlorophos TaxID=658473 RepID=A0A8H6W1N4_MYCCL|nr:hypothetical protein HMN09_00975700 [Mycena chlorophos]